MSTTKSWPSLQAYRAAVLRPQECFTDAVLCASTTDTNANGQIIEIVGESAVVYKVQNTTTKHAVRLFLSPVVDQKEIYVAAKQQLRGLSLPAMVDFDYIERGIRIGDEFFPMVLMAWAEGERLHEYLDRQIKQSTLPPRLAARWRGAMAGLRGANLQHGDLRHDNILVDNQARFRLVDYDTLYIPALQGLAGQIPGHPNYRHPQMVTSRPYDKHIDTFSDLVIYISLLAIDTDPGIWRFHNGDNLIFTVDDFRQPNQTTVWFALRTNPNREIQQLIETLARVCNDPTGATPDLETILHQMQGTTTTRRLPQTSADQMFDLVPETEDVLQLPLFVPHTTRIAQIVRWTGLGSTIAMVGAMVLAIAGITIQGESSWVGGLGLFLGILASLGSLLAIVVGIGALMTPRVQHTPLGQRYAIQGIVGALITLILSCITIITIISINGLRNIRY